MKTREKTAQILKEYWGTEKFIFHADFHIPKNITLREGSRPFGYFRNFRLNGEDIDYPVEQGDTHDRRISIYQIIKEGLEDNQRYEVTVELSNDNYRKNNPYSLTIKRFKKLAETFSNTQNQVLENTIEQIFSEKINIGSPFTMVELANSVESLATDIYSENKRFIYELIQNADDAATDDNAELSIDVLSNYVVISHSGAPFDPRDIRGLCSIGIGTKSEDATKTGYKGIGFKSVFGQPDGIVYVKSEETLFRFDRDYASTKGWNPDWGNKELWEKKNRITFNCPWQMMPILSDQINDIETQAVLNDSNYSVKTAIKIKDANTLYNDINELFQDANFMLFLRRVKSVRLNSKEYRIHLEKVKHEKLLNAVSLQKNGKLISNYLVKRWVHAIKPNIQKDLKSDLKTPKKIQNMVQTEISFALKLDETNENIELLNLNESPIYSYLPTSVIEYNFPFIVNANFLLDAGREKIHKNRIWNEWLFQVIGYKMIQCCSELSEDNQFNSTYISLLRNGFYHTTDNLSQKINAGLNHGFEDFSFIRNNKNELSKLKEICLDPYLITNVDSSFNGFFAEYLNTTEENLVLKGENIIPLSDENKLLRKFSIKELDETILQDFFSSEHRIEAITLESNFKILQFIRPFEENDPSGKWYTVVTKFQLIINNKGELDYITKVCFPMGISADNDEEYQNRLIHDTIFESIEKDVELFQWLQKLGVTEPGSIAYLEKEIIGNIDTCITNENYLDLTEFIFDLHSSGKLEKEHYINLQELPLKTNKGLIKANQCVLTESYNPTINFSELIKSVPAISTDYLEIAGPKDFRQFFKLLNVTDDIDYIKLSKKSSTELNPRYVDNSNTFSKDGHAYPHLIGIFTPNTPQTDVPFYLQTFSFFDEINSISFAVLFWERIFEKFQMKKDKTTTIKGPYEKEKAYIDYNIGNNKVLRTLDKMSWGRFPANTTHTLGYFFWQLENLKCMPTLEGMKLPKETFVNSEYNKELAGDFLPILDLKKQVPDDWRKVLKLKSKLALLDLLEVLEKISDKVASNGTISKDNQKRIGLIYTELLSYIEKNEDSSVEDIENWSSSNQLVSSSKKSLEPQSLIWIKVPGFENVSSGIDTIYLPTNVDKKSPYLETLLDAFGVRIIEDFSYEADEKTEFFNLKIKLLKLLGPIALILKDRMFISDIDKFIYERFQSVSKTKFFKCQNLRPVFRHDAENIEGEAISHYFDKNNKEFLLSIEWNNPVSLLNISFSLSTLISAVKLEKELMVLLQLNASQISEYLLSLKLEPSDYENCSSYTEVLELIDVLENKVNPTLILDIKIPPIQEHIQPIAEGGFEIEDEEVNNEEKLFEKKSQENSSKYEYSSDELSQIKKLFGRELDNSELEEENLFAQVKALRYFKDLSYEISMAENDFLDNFEDRLLTPIIDENGNAYKVMCRSARRGILFFGAYAWTNLGDTNTLLYVLTGDKSTDCLLIRNQEELEQLFSSHYKVLRRKNTSFEELKNLIEAETELSELQLLYKVKGSSFDIIFNPQQNNPGDTEGPLTDIGEDI